ncbi:MAG: ABC transporter permease [Oscillospiraceae bacterium]|nr:ABC transporter permease [Oscillospiraceae bacterium]
MRLSKERFRGFDRVCSFTLEQLLKSRSNRATLIILFVIALISMPVITLVSGGGISLGGRDTIETVYFVNETSLPVELETAGLAERVVYSSGVPGEHDALVKLTEENGEYRGHTELSPDTGVSAELIVRLTELVNRSVENAQFRSMGFSDELLRNLQKPVSTVQSGESGLSRTYYVQLIFSILVMMISVMSASYIIRSVVEEKVSKLVELLMVSVDPLSLILGKIVAVILYMLITLAVLIVGFLLSNVLAGLIFGAAPGAANALSALDGSFGPLSVLVAVISLLLGVLTFALIAGLSGVGCSTMEDTSGAQGLTMLLLMGGYMISIFMGMVSSGAAAKVLSLIPFLSVYIAPVKFATGEIGFGIVLISWIIQAAVALLMLLICAKVYSDLLIYKGSRVRFSAILSMAFGRKGA